MKKSRLAKKPTTIPDIYLLLSGQFSFIRRQLTRIEGLMKREVKEQMKLDDDIKALQDTVTAEETVEDSAIALMTGIPTLIAKAVADALAAGATDTQLKAITDLGTAITNKTTALAGAITAGTPAAPPVPGGKRPNNRK